MKEQTAVEWFAENINGHISEGILNEIYKQAKQIEKEQIINAFDEGQEYEYHYHINSAPKFDSETYYNEIFNK